MNTPNNESKKPTTTFKITNTAANDSFYLVKAKNQPNHNGKDFIYVGEREEIMTASYYNRLWMAVSTLSVDIPRRQWVDKISIDVANFNGVILNKNGSEFNFPDIDALFGADVWENRWMSGFLRANEAGTAPHSISRNWQKVQLIDLSLRIAHPHLAQHFGK